MTHLGTQLSALADGQLGQAARERALAHVAGCLECAQGLAAARQARRALAGAFDVAPAADLTARLLALGATPTQEDLRSGPQGSGRHNEQPGQRAARAGALPGEGSVPLPGTGSRLPAGCLRGDVHGRRTVPARLLMGAGAGLTLVAAVLFVLGGATTIAPTRHPAHALTVLARAGAQVGAATPATAVQQALWTTSAASATADDGVAGPSADATAADPTVTVDAWLDAHPWASPVAIPDGYRVVGVRVDPDGVDALEVDLAGSHGLVVVTLTHGLLDPNALAGAEQVAVAGRDVSLLSSAPWHAVWQCGDSVVSVVAEVPSEAADAVVGSYPAQAYDDGAPARVVRGWQVLAGVLNSP